MQVSLNFSMFSPVLPQIDFNKMNVGDYFYLPSWLTKAERKGLYTKAKRSNKKIETHTHGAKVLVRVADHFNKPEKNWTVEYYRNDVLISIITLFDISEAENYWNNLHALPNEDYLFFRNQTGTNGKLESVSLGAK